MNISTFGIVKWVLIIFVLFECYIIWTCYINGDAHQHHCIMGMFYIVLFYLCDIEDKLGKMCEQERLCGL